MKFCQIPPGKMLLKTLRLIKEVRIVKKKSTDFFKYSLLNLRAP